jgi:nucleoside phosphorylase/predicted nucleotidyltransferase
VPPLRDAAADKRREVRLPKLLTRIQQLEPGIGDVHIFGSRRHRSGSVRSDIDLLVRTAGDRPLTHEFAEAVWELETYLDVFHDTRGVARSLINESQIAAASSQDLVTAVDGILIWSNGKWVGPTELESHDVLRSQNPAMTMAELYELRDPRRRDFVAVIVTALSQEFIAVTASVDAESIENLRAEATIVTSAGPRWLLIESANKSGQAPIALTALRAGAMAKARLIVLCGITAGLAGATHLGDIVVPDMVIDYELQRVTGMGADPGFRAYPASDSFRRSAATLVHEGWRPSDACLALAPEAREPNILLDAVMLSGSKVVASAEHAKKIGLVHRKVAAIEMEGAGVAEAALALSCEFAVVKCVSDYADERKDDSWHPYAMKASAEFALATISRLT